MDEKLLKWLLAGDVAIQYQVRRHLLGEQDATLQDRIAHEGWGAAFLAQRGDNGHWGRGFYQPKWISSHYTLLDLRYLELPSGHPAPRETIALILHNNKAEDGGVNPGKTIKESDICVNGMLLTYACYFGAPEQELRSVVDFLIGQQMADGGFNCQSNRQGAVHSSLHSTLSILEGIHEYAGRGYGYRLAELQAIAAQAREFILLHRLFRSDHTGEIIDRRFLMLSYPSRWFYDILRALVYFAAAGVPYDPRMSDALDVLRQKRRKDGAWPVQAKHAGQVHFDMEKTGGPSRWNTLRALRVLSWAGLHHFEGEG